MQAVLKPEFFRILLRNNKSPLIILCLQGLSWPAMHSMTAQWIPPNERSKFVTAYLGSSVGTAVFYPIFGYILAYLSWEWVFHLSAFFGTIWYVCWLYLVYDTPAKHPRIDPQERAYIENAIGDSFKVDKKVTAHCLGDFVVQPLKIASYCRCFRRRIKRRGVQYSHRARFGLLSSLNGVASGACSPCSLRRRPTSK